MQLQQLISVLDELLQPNLVKDYCHNGLQIEGKPKITKIVTGVTASLALINKAIELNADAILVHHGYFWKGESPEIIGMKKQRVAALLKHDISLLAYHLPIDVHPIYGNNKQLGDLLGLQDIQAVSSIEPKGIVMSGKLSQAMEHHSLLSVFKDKLGRDPISVGNKSNIKQLAWCTGGGQGFIDAVANQTEVTIDAFVSGEISEQTTHSAIEQNIDYFAIGHHASERYGVKAVGEYLASQYALDVTFVDIHNPA
ncbi:Nif3-like dinuclear metal center hexameric protein [Glaciecola sp. 1036]|uniref:Nif3-like dinuclear metal center hexameric protein n=1 Tax=Alteromonadaceae TaxID=72275 RepID=UPI003D001392